MLIVAMKLFVVLCLIMVILLSKWVNSYDDVKECLSLWLVYRQRKGMSIGAVLKLYLLLYVDVSVKVICFDYVLLF